MRKKNQGPRSELPTLVLPAEALKKIEKLTAEPKEPGTKLREAAKRSLAS